MKNKRRNSFSVEDRERAVLLILESGHSIGMVSRSLLTSHSLVSRWVSAYKQYGLSGLCLRNKVHYDGDFKLSILKDMTENHLSLHQASTKYQITQSVLSKWRCRYQEFGVSALYEEKPRGRPPKMKSPKKTSDPQKAASDAYQELLDENLRLRIENAYLKKLQTLTQKNSGRKPSKS